MSSARKMLMGGRKVTSFPTSHVTSYTTYYTSRVSYGHTERRSRTYRGVYQEYDVYVEDGSYDVSTSRTTSNTTTYNTWKYTSW